MKMLTLISSIGFLVSSHAIAGPAANMAVASYGASSSISASQAYAQPLSSIYADKISADNRAIMRAKVNPGKTAVVKSSPAGSLSSCGKLCMEAVTLQKPNYVVPNLVQQQPVFVKPGVINSNPAVLKSAGAMALTR